MAALGDAPRSSATGRWPAVFAVAAVAGAIAGFLFTWLAGEVDGHAEIHLDMTALSIAGAEPADFSVYRAEAITRDPEFRQGVLSAIGDESLDFERFDVELEDVYVADGVSRGTLDVRIRDDDGGKATRYRDAFAGVFTEEYRNADGLLRRLPIENRRQVAESSGRLYREAYAALRPRTDQLGLPLDELVRDDPGSGSTLADELNREEVRLRAELALIDAQLSNPALANSSFQASMILGVGVPEGAGELALRQRREIIIGAINQTVGRRGSLSDGNLPPDILAELDSLRALARLKDESYLALNAAIIGAEGLRSELRIERWTSDSPAGQWWAGTLVGLGVMAVAGAALVGPGAARRRGG